MKMIKKLKSNNGIGVVEILILAVLIVGILLMINNKLHII